MLVPVTDPENPYSKMMIELIADQTPFPKSPLPRRRVEPVSEPLSGRQRAGVAVGVAALAAIAVVGTLGVIRTLQP